MAPSKTLALLGAIVIVTLGGGLAGGLPAIPQEVPLIAQMHRVTMRSVRLADRALRTGREFEIFIDRNGRARPVPLRSS